MACARPDITTFHFLKPTKNLIDSEIKLWKKLIVKQEGEHLRLSNNISAKPLPQFFKLDIHAKRSLTEIFW